MCSSVAREDPPFQQKYMFLCYFKLQNPFFHVWTSSDSPPFSVRGRSLSPLFLNPPWHIHVYITLSDLSTPRPYGNNVDPDQVYSCTMFAY